MDSITVAIPGLIYRGRVNLLAEVTFEMRKDLLQEISDQEDDRIFDAILENSRGVEKIENTGQS